MYSAAFFYVVQAQGLLQRAWNHFTVALDIDARSMLGFEGRAIVNLQMGDTFAALQDMNAALKVTFLMTYHNSMCIINMYVLVMYVSFIY